MFIPVSYTHLDVYKRQVLVHVKTKKGKGYKPAEQCPDKYHGIGSFDLKTGLPKSQGPAPSFTEVLGKAVVDLAAEHPNMVAITAACLLYTSRCV